MITIMQEQVLRVYITVVKVGTNEDVAYALTTYVTRDGMLMHMRSTNQHLVSGRHELAPTAGC